MDKFIITTLMTSIVVSPIFYIFIRSIITRKNNDKKYNINGEQILNEMLRLGLYINQVIMSFTFMFID